MISNLHTFVVILQERESEARRLRRETDADRQGLEEARQACLERERGLSAMEERLRERGLEADDLEVRILGNQRRVLAEAAARSYSASLASCHPWGTNSFATQSAILLADDVETPLRVYRI